MKILAIGCGRCGGRIADDLADLGKKARADRHADIVLDSFAVNTHAADFDGLSSVPSDAAHRIVLGNGRTLGQGVAKDNGLAAAIARDEGSRVVEAVRRAPKAGEADALLMVAGASGGSGSGLFSPLARQLKEHFPGKPLYGFIVLPSEREEDEDTRISYNAGTCLKSAYLAADAVFLIDNRKYLRKDESLKPDMNAINSRMVAPFYNLLSAGEERNPKHIGAKTLDAGDIMQSLSGWTVLGHSRDHKGGTQSSAPMPVRSSAEEEIFRGELANVEKGNHLIGEALHELSLECDAADARRALYLLTGPHDAINIYIMEVLGGSLRRASPNATIRGADYPRERRNMELVLILSELTRVERVTEILSRTVDYLAGDHTNRKGQEPKPVDEETFGKIPLLL